MAYSTTWDARQRLLGPAVEKLCKGQFRYGEAAPGLGSERWTIELPQNPHVRAFALYCSMRPRQASQLDPTTRVRISQMALRIFARLGHSLEIRCAGPWQADKSFRSTTA